MKEIVTVMTYNIRSAKLDDGWDSWGRRRDSVADVLRAHRPDLVGFQEAQRTQLDDLGERLSAYDYVGSGRLDGETKGEYCAIGYRNDRFELLDCSTFWLSETPDEPGSVGWDASHSRIVTYAGIEDSTTGDQLYVFNTHLDHQSPPDKRGERARRESVRILRSRIDRIDPDVPVVITGDFNCHEDERPYQIMVDRGAGERPLNDARYASRLGHHGPTTTCNDFEEPKPEHTIDYIFVTADCEVVSHGTYEHTYHDGRYPSDHYPIVATILC